MQVEVQERTQKKWNATNYQQHGDSVKVTADIASMTSAEFDGVVSDYKAAVSSGKLIMQVPTGQGGPHVYATVDQPVKKEKPQGEGRSLLRPCVSGAGKQVRKHSCKNM